MKIRAYLYLNTVSPDTYLCGVDNLEDDQACQDMLDVLSSKGYTCVLIGKGQDKTHYVYIYVVSKCLSN